MHHTPPGFQIEKTQHPFQKPQIQTSKDFPHQNTNSIARLSEWFKQQPVYISLKGNLLLLCKLEVLKTLKFWIRSETELKADPTTVRPSLSEHHHQQQHDAACESAWLSLSIQHFATETWNPWQYNWTIPSLIKAWYGPGTTWVPGPVLSQKWRCYSTVVCDLHCLSLTSS